MKNNTFGQNLKHLRKSKELKQIEIAPKLGIKLQSYSAYENGREPSYDLLVKIADLFNVTVDYLLGHDTTNATNPMQEENSVLKEKLLMIKSII